MQSTLVKTAYGQVKDTAEKARPILDANFDMNAATAAVAADSKELAVFPCDLPYPAVRVAHASCVHHSLPETLSHCGITCVV